MKKTITIRYGQLASIVKWFINKDGFYLNAALPVRARRNLKNIAKKIDGIYAEYIEDFEESFAKYRSDEYSSVSEDVSDMRKVKDEFLQDYQREMRDFYSIESEIEITPIEINDVQSLTISPADFDVLELFLTDER